MPTDFVLEIEREPADVGIFLGFSKHAFRVQ